MAIRQTPERNYEIKIEPEDGYNLRAALELPGKDTAWHGWRLFYRRLGSKRWSKFLLKEDDQTLGYLHQIIAKHEAHLVK